MSETRGSIEIRTARAEDHEAILDLLVSSLRWVPGELFERFFSWKHEESPFGRSPAWVATVGDRIVGFRTFVRWEYEHPDGHVRRAVRAVDTATHPDHQGQKIFSRLTLHALDELRADGVDFVFNTPNDKSRPGYLKMGWREIGRLPTAVRPASLPALVRMARARVPADRWSQRSDAGAPALEVLADPAIDTLLGTLGAARGLRTRRSAAYLRWRYGFGPLAYRAIALDDDPARGVVIFRVRARGSATEAAVCDALAPGTDASAVRALEKAVARAARADYVIRLGGSSPASGFVRLPGQGPMLTWRDVSGRERRPGIDDWQLQLGDIELF